jgi:hypothetical protein
MRSYDFSTLSPDERGRAIVRMLAAEGVDLENVFLVLVDEAKALINTSLREDATTQFKKVEVQRHSNGELKSATQTVTTKLQEHLDCVTAMVKEIKLCYFEK